MAYAMLFTGVLIIGFTAIFVKWAEAPGTVSAFYRMSVASVALIIPFFYYLKKKNWQISRRGAAFAVAGGVCFGLDIAFWMTGVMMGEATTPTLMANTAPVWVGLVSLLFFHEKQRVLFWAGLCAALGGAVLILRVNFQQSLHVGMGAFYGLIASFLYAAFHLFSQRGRQLLNTIAYFWIFTTAGAVVLLILNLFSNTSIFGYSATSKLCFLALGLIGHVGGWLAITYAQGHLPASLIAPSMLVQPVVTAILAVFLLGDVFSVWQIAGGAAVLMGIYCVHYSHA